ncbi:UNVERIFIED_CONTAM: SH3 domain-containing YSC84-like protein 1 [Siphonaria sp. JEL0065]|nr:SH3 domain-containing YSC84-like protein 1 [Siphonaria sp. JEL0065]
MHTDTRSVKYAYDIPNECSRAAEVLHHFISESGDQSIPAYAIARAKGIAIIHVLRAGFHYSGNFGSGVVLSRLPDGSWSAPSKIKTAGVGAGFLIGAEITDHVMLLNTDEAVAGFYQDNITIGGNFTLSAGPVGQSSDAICTIVGKPLPVYSYSKSRGLYAGISLEGGVWFEGKEANSAFYGRPISARDILTGVALRPASAEALYSELPVPTYTEKAGDLKAATNIKKEPRVFTIPIQSVLPSSSSATLDNTNRPLPVPPGSGSEETVFCLALHDYEGFQEENLSFKQGDTVRVTKKNADGWWFGHLEKKEGTFPSTFVRQL